MKEFKPNPKDVSIFIYCDKAVSKMLEDFRAMNIKSMSEEDMKKLFVERGTALIKELKESILKVTEKNIEESIRQSLTFSGISFESILPYPDDLL